MERENNEPHYTRFMRHLTFVSLAWILFKSQEVSQTSFHFKRIRNISTYYLGELRFTILSFSLPFSLRTSQTLFTNYSSVVGLTCIRQYMSSIRWADLVRKVFKHKILPVFVSSWASSHFPVFTGNVAWGILFSSGAWYDSFSCWF